VGSFWREDEPGPASSPNANLEGIASAPGPRHAPAALGWAVVAVVAAAGVWRLADAAIESRVATTEPVLAPIAAGGGWIAATEAPSLWSPRFVAPSAELRQAFARDGRMVGVYIAYYRGQAQGHELVAHDNVIVKSSDRHWKKIAEGTATLPWDGAPLAVGSTTLRGARDVVAVRHWYWVAGRWTASATLAKVYFALAQLSGRGDDSAAVIIYTVAAGSDVDPSADRTLVHFASAMSKPIREALERAQSQ
jgi:EpsI family protein